MEFDAHPESSGPESFLIPFDAGPVAPLQNDALASGEEIPGKCPQLIFETDSKRFIPQIGAQLRRPFVLVQPDGGNVGCGRRASADLPDAGSPQISTRRVWVVARRSSPRSEVTWKGYGPEVGRLVQRRREPPSKNAGLHSQTRSTIRQPLVRYRAARSATDEG